jgi:septal ring factor EnvC (AmiA/AmiB activator)
MRYLLVSVLCLIGLTLSAADFEASLNELENVIESLERDLAQAAELSAEQLKRLSEMQNELESLKKQIAASEKLTATLKASLLKRTEALKSLTRRLQEHVAELEKQDKSLANLERRINVQRIITISLAVIVVIETGVIIWKSLAKP